MRAFPSRAFSRQFPLKLKELHHDGQVSASDGLERARNVARVSGQSTSGGSRRDRRGSIGSYYYGQSTPLVLFEPSAIFALSLQILVVRKDTDGKGVYNLCIGTRTTITFDELSNIVVRKYSNILFAIGSCFFKKNRRPCQLQHRLCSVKSISYLVIRKISPPV